MATFRLVVSMDNAAFADGYGGRHELYNAIQRSLERIEDVDRMSIMDTNGNTVGEWWFEIEEEEV